MLFNRATRARMQSFEISDSKAQPEKEPKKAKKLALSYFSRGSCATSKLFIKGYAGAMFWSQGLVKEMRENNVYEDKDIAVIRDKFPKAKHHFLVLPKINIKNLQGLEKSHLPLLKIMESKGLEVAKDLSDEETNFRLGYHAIPSMERLHLHIISDDFIATGLKTKKHWNSYTTDFFIPSSEMISRLENEGKITIKQDYYKSLLHRPLKCHKCSYMPRTMPDLKDHLTKHITDNKS